MWQLLERKISFVNCFFVYFIYLFIFCHPHFSLFFFLLFLLSAFFFHPHFPFRIRHPQVSGPRFTDTLIQVFKLSEWLNIRASCQWRFLLLSFFPFFYLCFLIPCMLATFAWELNTTVRTSMTVKDLCHLFQFRREEVQADMLSLIFVFMILSVSNIFALHTRITVD